MMLYSLHGARPTALPFRILVNGTTRTDPSTFTEGEITAAGFTGPYAEPPYNTTTEQLAWASGAYTITALPPPPPQARWVEFAGAMADSSELNAFILTLSTAAPILERMLSVGLGQAAQGDTSTFLAAWTKGLAIGAISAEIAAGMAQLAAGFDLPAEFLAALTPEPEVTIPKQFNPSWNPPENPSRGQEWTAPDGSVWKWDQPRDPQTGQYIADDPATPAQESELQWIFTP